MYAKAIITKIDCIKSMSIERRKQKLPIFLVGEGFSFCPTDVIKPCDQINLGEKWFVCLASTSQSKKVRAGTQARQEPGGRNWNRNTEESFLLTCSPGCTLVSYMVKDYLHSDATVRSDLGPLNSILAQEKCPHGLAPS